MKKIAISFLLLLLLSKQALAISTINTLVIQDAQEYGRRRAYETYSTFLKPWTSFEEKAQILSELTEQAYIFTPYVLVATDARERVLSNVPILVENSEKALAQYDGYLVFSIKLYAQDASAFANLSASLNQNQQVIPVYYISPSSKRQMKINGKPIANAQFYLYFVDKAIQRNQPLVLLVSDGAHQTRSFFFDLSKML